MTTSSSTKISIAVANYIIHILRNPSPATPLSPILDDSQEALQQFADIFANATTPVLPSPTIPIKHPHTTHHFPPMPRVDNTAHVNNFTIDDNTVRASNQTVPSNAQSQQSHPPPHTRKIVVSPQKTSINQTSPPLHLQGCTNRKSPYPA